MFAWAVTLSALSFVAWIIPVRDRCWDPRAPASTRAPVTRSTEGCVLHLRSGSVLIDADQCGRLKCEPGVVSTLVDTRPAALAALLLLYALGTLAWSARWRALLGFADVQLSVLEVWRISTEAQAGGVLLPGGLGGDALRIAHVLARPHPSGGPRPRAAIVVASVLLDRAIGLALIAAVAAGLGCAFRSGAAGADEGPMLAALAAIPLAVAIGLVVLRRAPIERAVFWSQGRIGNVARPVLGPVLAYLRDARAPRAVAAAVALSFVVAAVQFAVIRGLVFAVGASPVQEKWVYVGTAMAFIVAAVPALPGAWGTADATFVFFFGHAGIPPAAALAVCLLFRLFWYLSAVVGAVLHVTRPGLVVESGGRDP